MKKIIILSAVLVILVVAGWSYGLRFTETAAVTSATGKDIQPISSEETEDGTALLFKEKSRETFGVARLEEYFGFLYKYDSVSYDHLEEGKPFEVTGLGNQDNFVIAIQTAAGSDITYIAIGNHVEGIAPSDPYQLSLEEVKANGGKYHLERVSRNYVLCVLKNISNDTRTIRAFDEEGNLVADKLLGYQARYVDWS